MPVVRRMGNLRARDEWGGLGEYSFLVLPVIGFWVFILFILLVWFEFVGESIEEYQDI